MKEPQNGSVIIIDDDRGLRENLADRLRAAGYVVLVADNGQEGLDIIRREVPEAVLLDLNMPVMSGDQVLGEVVAEGLETTVIVLTAHGSIERAVESMRAGAYDFMTKPPDAKALTASVGRAVEHERLRRDNAYLRSERADAFPSFVGSSAAMKEVREVARKAADSNATVLLLGESGTGKEVLARHIHQWSPRSERPFVAVNCVGLVGPLLESELFGHERGAFTGAHQRRAGRFEVARGGTLFLDEIGSTQPELQLKLLRVLQEGTFERVGGTQALRADVRVLAATNHNLLERIDAGAFLQDLYYRLNVISISLPPLRQRREDIAELADLFLKKFVRETKRRVEGISRSALASLEKYDWPGNVRELENAIERAVVLGTSGEVVLEDLPEQIVEDTPSRVAGPRDYRMALEDFRRGLVCDVLEECGGNQSQAAEVMGLDRAYLSRLIKRLGLR